MDVIYSNTKMCIHCAIKDKVIVPVGLNKPNVTESVYLPVADVLSDREKLNLHWDKVLTEKQWYSKNGNVTPFAAMSDLHKTYTIQKLLDMNNETCDRIALELTGLLNISIANKIIKHTQGENN